MKKNNRVRRQGVTQDRKVCTVDGEEKKKKLALSFAVFFSPSSFLCLLTVEPCTSWARETAVEEEEERFLKWPTNREGE